MHERVVCVRECVCVWFDDTEPNANHNIVLGVRVFCIVVYMVRIHSPIYVLISATTVSLSLSHVTIKYTHIVYAKKKNYPTTSSTLMSHYCAHRQYFPRSHVHAFHVFSLSYLRMRCTTHATVVSHAVCRIEKKNRSLILVCTSENVHGISLFAHGDVCCSPFFRLTRVHDVSWKKWKWLNDTSRIWYHVVRNTAYEWRWNVLTTHKLRNTKKKKFKWKSFCFARIAISLRFFCATSRLSESSLVAKAKVHTAHSCQ